MRVSGFRPVIHFTFIQDWGILCTGVLHFLKFFMFTLRLVIFISSSDMIPKSPSFPAHLPNVPNHIPQPDPWLVLSYTLP